MHLYQLISVIFYFNFVHCKFLNNDKVSDIFNNVLLGDKNYQELEKILKQLVEDKIVNLINEKPIDSQPKQDFLLNEYHRYDEIRKFLSSSAKKFADIASTFEVGTSYEGREIIGIKIGKPSKYNKRGLFIDAGTHAREWIAPAAALYIINTFLTEYGTNETVQNLLDNLDFYIVPNVNPDGYEYSWTTDRLWRKTRSRQSCNTFRCCFGVDPNRNWDYHWGETGASDDPCSEMYQGPAPFSEPETKALSQTILSLRNDLDVYISLHSYGQLWLIPYGFKENAYSSDFKELFDLAVKAGNELEKVHGTKYKVENAAELYPASGASDDWTKAVAGIKYSFTIELRPGNFAENDSSYDAEGFILPPDQIIPTGEEVFAALTIIANKLLNA